LGEPPMITVDGNEGVASVAYRLSDMAVIYPITPSSPIGELADDWAAHGRVNLWGATPEVVEMQSEAGAIGSVHGALQAGALCTTFTASQGLLLMIPNMYKIAGELTPLCIHVAARTVSTHALSIFGDHSDVMACRQTGFAMLASGSVQEAQDLACVAHVATLESRVPILHFFDGFRTSHEVAKIHPLSDDDLRAMSDQGLINAHRRRALTPDAPQLRGTAQNPDTFFQAREAANPFYDACPGVIQAAMDRFAGISGRQYDLVEYVGDPEADRVVVAMGSSTQTIDQTVQRLCEEGDAKVGVIKIRLYRPFPKQAFIDALPKSVKKIAVLDRTKEPGGAGEPLYLDIVATLGEAAAMGELPMEQMPLVRGGRYGLSSKEFNPAMVKGVFDELAGDAPRNNFTVGINDDVTHSSIDYDPDFNIESDDIVKAVFFGLGSDGTVGANKNTVKIIGEETDEYAQAYFVYDSRKAGAGTISHLRFGPRPIRSAYLIRQANFVGVHQWVFLDRIDIIGYAKPGATLLINSPYGPDETWDRLSVDVQEEIIAKELKLYVIDAYSVARGAGMGSRINTIMQTCFFAISGVLPREEAIAHIKTAIEKTYGRRGPEVVSRNFAAVDQSLANLHEVAVPGAVTSVRQRPPTVSEAAPDIVQRLTSMMLEGKGDLLPVSAFTPDGTWPVATTQWEKRNIAIEVPIWEPALCIQCNKCAFVCPHAAIRAKVVEADELSGAPASFRDDDYKARDFPGWKYVLQVAPEDCTGCSMCYEVCPAEDKTSPGHKAINMTPHDGVVAAERTNYDFFLDLPEIDRSQLRRLDVKGSQFLLPLFEYSGACAGCGETPYIKLLTQMFGDRMLIANATGCSSIYGGNLPTTPYALDGEGRGPAWSNSLFEDNAEFGAGFRLAVDSNRRTAEQIVTRLAPEIGADLARELLEADQSGGAAIDAQRDRVADLRERLAKIDDPAAASLAEVADYLVEKSIWIIGGDGWAYDIGFGGLDHVMAMNRNVNILVLDTEVYSNTGGQASKATPLGAVARFAAAGKTSGKKDLGLMAMSYGHVYVANVAMGSSDAHTVRAFQEAESYPGASLIIAYSHCIAHGYDMRDGLTQQRLASESGVWPLYRFDPRRIEQGKPPLQLDSRPPSIPVEEYMQNENRFAMVKKTNPDTYARLLALAQQGADRRTALYRQMAEITYGDAENGEAG
jgi:pyruvate-ferredoxin/flavodoxin oxidoreductase